MAFEYLEQYSTFDSVADMDAAVEDHIQQHYFDLTESERAIVFTLASRSLMYPGASHLKAETIADQVGVSTKTVYRSIKKLVELNIIEKVPGTKLNGIKGASIYRILPFTNNVPSEVSQRVTVDEASNDVAIEQVFEKQSFNSFNLLKTSPINVIYNNAHAEKEVCKEWMNGYQVMLFDFMHSLPLTEQLKDELHKVVLASGVDSVQAFHMAKEVIFNIARDISSGVLTVTRTLRAVFTGAYNKRMERSYNKKVNASPKEDKAHSESPVVFYDWMKERESYAPIVSNVVDNDFIPNWLEW